LKIDFVHNVKNPQQQTGGGQPHQPPLFHDPPERDALQKTEEQRRIADGRKPAADVGDEKNEKNNVVRRNPGLVHADPWTNEQHCRAGRAEKIGRPGAEQRRQRPVRRLDLGDVAVARVERAGGHRHHRHIDEPRQGERDDHLAVGEAQQLAPLIVVTRRRAVLGQAGMEIDRMRHHRRADDADRDGQRGKSRGRRDQCE